MNISFPGLKIDLELSREAFTVLGIPIYWYGIIIALAFLAAVLLGLRSCKKFDLEPDHILDLVLFAAPAAIIGARLYFVIFSWDQYKDNLIDVIKIRDGGLAVYGGVIAGMLVAWLYARKKKISPLNLIDFGVPYLALGQAIGRWGNFFNQEAFGAPTALPWRMNGVVADSYLNSLLKDLDLSKWGVHPAFLYESLWDFALFFFLIWFRKKKKVKGEVMFLYLIGYGVGRFMIEGLRTDSLYLGSFRVSQLLSALLVIAATSLFIIMRVRKNKAEDDEPVERGQSQYGSLLMKLKEDEAAKEATEDTEDLKDSDDSEDSEGTEDLEGSELKSTKKAIEEIEKKADANSANINSIKEEK